MSEKPDPIIIQVLNPGAFSGRSSLIVLELMDQAAAVKVARRIADETGRGVAVRDARMDVIEIIPAARTH
jgi:Tfp pilus assembly protein PilP